MAVKISKKAEGQAEALRILLEIITGNKITYVTAKGKVKKRRSKHGA